MAFRHFPGKYLLPFLLMILVFFPLLSSCTSSNVTTGKSTPTATREFLAPACRVPICTVTPVVPGVRPFIDSWNNIHAFQTFDYNVANPAAVAKRYDFVWGARLNHVAALRSSNPDIYISYYLPFHRDHGTFANIAESHPLSYWKATHPDWVLYQCDRVTPAYYYSDTGDVPLDFTNPAVISWQLQTYAIPASQRGYDAIAADNVDLLNGTGVCGVYKNGKWVQQYTGEADDPQWRAGIVTWATMMQQALHHLAHPMALIVNLGLGNLPLNNPQIQEVVTHLDGISDEGGFTDYGMNYLTGDKWLQKVRLIESVQNQGKAYYVINQFPNTVGRTQIQWALASYLMSKEHISALFISTLQGYGGTSWYEEYSAAIGTPSGPMYQAQNVYFRDYSNGLSIVNPDADSSYTVTLNAKKAYKDLYGNVVGHTVTLPPHSGIVLLSTS